MLRFLYNLLFPKKKPQCLGSKEAGILTYEAYNQTTKSPPTLPPSSTSVALRGSYAPSIHTPTYRPHPQAYALPKGSTIYVGRCIFCNGTLTDPRSIRARMGKDCARLRGLGEYWRNA